MSQLSNVKNVREILNRHGFSFSKKLGQNFIVNPSVCPRIPQSWEALGLDTGVLEIGPGLGVLTWELASRARKIVAIELDERLLPVLEETLSEFDNVTVIQGDVLKIDSGRADPAGISRTAARGARQPSSIILSSPDRHALLAGRAAPGQGNHRDGAEEAAATVSAQRQAAGMPALSARPSAIMRLPGYCFRCPVAALCLRHRWIRP